MPLKQPLANVLLVDDSHYDLVLTKIMFDRDHVMVNLISVGDGREAIAYLEQEPPFENSDLPDLVLLDLNMPDIDGLEVLKWMAQSEILKTIPVVVCSGSESNSDIAAARSFGAIDYLTKPLDLDKLAPIIARIPALELNNMGDQNFIYRAEL